MDTFQQALANRLPSRSQKSPQPPAPIHTAKALSSMFGAAA